ncbi:hypothetical protein BGW38_008008, partial [Lunasporangiospora selenospora]
MPNASKCSFRQCAKGLSLDNRENFDQSDEAHWKGYHIDEPFKFTCPFTGNDVEFRRIPEAGYKFSCVCEKASILYTRSVKRHYDRCSVAKRMALQATPTRTESAITDTSATVDPYSPPNQELLQQPHENREMSPTSSAAITYELQSLQE